MKYGVMILDTDLIKKAQSTLFPSSNRVYTPTGKYTGPRGGKFNLKVNPSHHFRRIESRTRIKVLDPSEIEETVIEPNFQKTFDDAIFHGTKQAIEASEADNYDEPWLTDYDSNQVKQMLESKAYKPLSDMIQKKLEDDDLFQESLINGAIPSLPTFSNPFYTNPSDVDEFIDNAPLDTLHKYNEDIEDLGDVDPGFDLSKFKSLREANIGFARHHLQRDYSKFRDFNNSMREIQEEHEDAVTAAVPAIAENVANHMINSWHHPTVQDHYGGDVDSFLDDYANHVLDSPVKIPTD